MRLKKTIDWPVGVCVLPDLPVNQARTSAHNDYVHEILKHAGLCYSAVSLIGLSESLPGLSVLVTVGDAELDPIWRSKLRTGSEKEACG